MNEFVFYIRYTRTGVRVLKEMRGRTEADALADLKAIQLAFRNGRAAFEIEGVDYFATNEHELSTKGVEMKDETSGLAVVLLLVSVVACVVIAVVFRL